MKIMFKIINKGIVIITISGLLGGCTHIGPRTIINDRYHYSVALSESWKRQILLNVVKIRYLDPPLFVDVGSIVAGYTLEQWATASTGWDRTNFDLLFDSIGLNGTMKYQDRPTITYTPLTGNAYVRGLVMPIPMTLIFYSIKAGWPADKLLFLTASKINGLTNQKFTVAECRPADEEFIQALELFRRIQNRGSVDMRMEKKEKGRPGIFIRFSAPENSETKKDIEEIYGLLNLDPEVNEFRMIFGGMAKHNNEIAFQSRSILHIMSLLSAYVTVPESHAEEGRAVMIPKKALESAKDLIKIHSSREEPEDAFAKIRYQKYWFWIDQTDLRSKQVFSFIMTLFSLIDTGGQEGLPMLTIPTQ